MSERDEFGAFLVGFIVGGLTGAVVALLFAPQSGEETRAVIKERSIELRDRAAEEAEAAWKRAEETALEARTKAEELLKQAQAQSEEITLKAREKGQELVETAKETVKKAASRVKKSEEIEAPAEVA
ncbi:MAG: YtxH domain-containing protein [Anaerolineales bacterium]|nr:YtxH domain-containing protein [Anaerolineales bacterium]MCX7756361.1 YtxH domain-containing protein [Anaerolineales bacterium]MDW8276695.1 YtxH domain-containing protein [Anaerolineales bacterium]